ncbi:MAG: PatB family C-S lyase [Spirochaetia bacterium]|jgi:cystathionine beta-lyase
MAYDFDTVVDRRGTNSVKWDYEEKYTGMTGLLPLWVADMDFPAPPEIMGAIRRRVDHGIFGYVREPDSYFEAAAAWLARRHSWRVPREWMVASPGVLPSLSAAILAFTQPGEGIVLQPPVYHPFAMRVRSNGRRVVENPLVVRHRTWQMDLDGLEKVIDQGTRMLVFCSPHNPVARVWERDTLSRLEEICRARGVLIVSDEIHNDLVMPGFRHVPIAALSEEAALNAVTLVAATKTFNIAGLGGSLAVIPDEDLRTRFEAVQHAVFSAAPNAVAVAASEAAWRHGERWLDELLVYIKGNYDLLRGFLAERLPSVRVFPLEGTYLALLDMSSLGLPDAPLKHLLLRDARVWLDEGTKFGRGGEGMQRLNLACPRSLLAQALERMEKAFPRTTA